MRILKKELRLILIQENRRLMQQVKELERRIQRADAANAQASEAAGHAYPSSEPSRGVS